MLWVDNIKSKASVSVRGIPSILRRIPLYQPLLNYISSPSAVSNSLILAAAPGPMAFDGRYLWVLHTSSSSVENISVVNPKLNSVVVTIGLGTSGNNCSAIVYSNGFIWVLMSTITSYIGQVYKINPVSYSMTVITLGTLCSNPISMASDGRYLWVGELTSGWLYKIDMATNVLVATVSCMTNIRPGMCFDGKYLWVPHYIYGAQRYISKVDVALNSVVATLTIGCLPSDICFDGKYIWVSNAAVENNLRVLSKIDPSLNTVVATVSIYSSPDKLCFDGRYLWVTCPHVLTGNSKLVKVNPLTDSLVGYITITNQPTDVCYDGVNTWTVFSGATLLERRIAT